MGVPCRGYHVQQTDQEFLTVLLTQAKLTDQQRAAFQAALLSADLMGKKCDKGTRDRGMAVLRAQKLLPMQPKKNGPKRKVGCFEEDRFSAVATEGTKIAEAILANRPLKPPGRAA